VTRIVAYFEVKSSVLSTTLKYNHRFDRLLWSKIIGWFYFKVVDQTDDFTSKQSIKPMILLQSSWTDRWFCFKVVERTDDFSKIIGLFNYNVLWSKIISFIDYFEVKSSDWSTTLRKIISFIDYFEVKSSDWSFTSM
jgi:hypothetical protein